MAAAAILIRCDLAAELDEASVPIRGAAIIAQSLTRTRPGAHLPASVRIVEWELHLSAEHFERRLGLRVRLVIPTDLAQ
jgi:hypothetical protein